MKARLTDGVAVAAAKASFSTATGYLLEGNGRADHPLQKARERRRPEPLVDIFDAEVVPMLKAAPGLRAVGIFRELERRHPSLDPGVRRSIGSSNRTVLSKCRLQCRYLIDLSVSRLLVSTDQDLTFASLHSQRNYLPT